MAFDLPDKYRDEDYPCESTHDWKALTDELSRCESCGNVMNETTASERQWCEKCPSKERE